MACDEKNDLVAAVLDHMKLYGVTFGRTEFTVDGVPVCDVDAMGIREDGTAVSVYALACHCTEETPTIEYAKERLLYAKDFINTYMPGVERINMIHVNQDHAYRIYDD